MQLSELVACSLDVGRTRSRRAKIERLASCIRALRGDEVRVAVSWLCGALPNGRIGVGYAAVMRDGPPPAPAASLSLLEVHAALERIRAQAGKGSSIERQRILGELLARATEDEQRFLRGLVVGEVRQGALEGIVLDAVAHASGVDGALVRRAAMLAGSLSDVAEAALTDGAAGVARFGLQLFRPVKPMLAQTCDDLDGAFERLGRAIVDYKLDGARVQIHRAASDVAVYTRRLNDVTAALPEVVEAVRALPCRQLVLDGEVLALGPDGRPLSFQTTMQRFGRKLDVAAMRERLPLSPFFFDCLLVDDEELLDAPGEARATRLSALVPPELLVPRVVTEDAEVADQLYGAAIAAGHEGIMVKSAAVAYEAGSRGAGWLKVKPVHTFDLVVLAVEWGSGRRRGWLSNLHLGARDPRDGSFVMVGKTFKGMTDELLAWQTEALQRIAVAREGHVVHVRPELVVEIAVGDVQQSPQYPAGLALRFARVRRYRPDKTPAQADTIEAVGALLDKGHA